MKLAHSILKKNLLQVLNLLMQRRKDSLSVIAGEPSKFLFNFSQYGALSSNQRSATALLNSRRSVCSWLLQSQCQH